MEGSLLETVGAEVIGIVSPVSICMLLVVLLVHSLNPHGSDSSVSSIAMLVYEEKDTDTTGQKFEGALLNALVFVVIITLVTFMLVALFYFRCTKCLRGYMGFSAFTVLAYMGGALGVMMVQEWSIPIDVITFSIVLLNFAVVGVLAVFFCRMPIVFTQGYLVMIGMLVAFWFTMLPEWTTWTLLMAMAVYDVLAVLVPVGPLNILVELAVARDEDIPALIYESRPIPSSRVPSGTVEFSSQGSPRSSSAPRDGRRRRWIRRTVTSSASQPQRERPSVLSRLKSVFGSAPVRQDGASDLMTHSSDAELGLASTTDRSPQNEGNGPPNIISANGLEMDGSQAQALVSSSVAGSPSDDESAPLVRTHISSPLAITAAPVDSAPQRQEIVRAIEEEEAEGIGLGMSGAIKLGLGDFIFYSVLVGRAAMYDLMTVYACYLAIIAGLGATLILLAVCRRALPALPISISLGILFYFLTRLVMEPFVVTLATDLVFF